MSKDTVLVSLRFYTERLKECPPLPTSPPHPRPLSTSLWRGEQGEESRIPLPWREGRRGGGQTLVRLVYDRRKPNPFNPSPPWRGRGGLIR